MFKSDITKRLAAKTTRPASALDASPTGLPSQTAHTGRAARIGLWSLILGFGGFLLWAGLAPLDEGVPSQGMIAIDTKRKAVQHLTGGLIKEVLVGKTTLSYTYTQPVGSNTAPYNLYHGTLEAVPVNATSSKLVYNLVFDNSMLADDAARARDITSKTNQFNGALANMKTLAETGAMPPAPAAPARGGGAAPAGRGG